MAGLETIGLIGTALSAAGAIVGGISASNQAKAQAVLAEMQAKEQRAAAHREVIRRGKEAQLIQSRQQAIAASTGGGAKDPTVLDLMGDVEAEGSYQKATAMYEGESRARGLEAQASMARMQARQALFSGFIGAGTSILSGFSGFEQYRTPPASSGSLWGPL